MKKLLALFASALAISALSSCDKTANTEDPSGGQPEEYSGKTMIYTTKVLYYGDRKTSGIYNYFFGLCDKEFIKDEQGDDAAPEGGSLVFFDLYSSTGTDSYETAELPEGKYSLSPDKAAGTLDSYYTRLQVFKDGKQVSVDFTSGTLEVKSTDRGKYLDAEFVLKTGEKFACRYEGPLVFGDPDAGSDQGIPPIKEDVNTKFVWAGAVYYGDEYKTGTERFDVGFTDKPVNDERKMTAAGHNLVLTFYTGPSQSIVAIPSGEYQVSDSYASGTIEPGEFIIGYTGSFCAKVDDKAEAVAISLIKSGKVKVENGADGYSFTFDLVTEEGVKIQGTYSGEMEIDDQSAGEAESTTTLTGDYQLDLTEATAKLAYYGDYFSNGTADWILSIENPSGDAIDIELVTEASSTTRLPLPEKGQYNMSVDNGVGVVKGESSAFGMLGTWYLDLSTLDENGLVFGYAAAIEGNVKLSKTGDTYDVSFEFVDEKYNLFSGSWSGQIPDAVNKTTPSVTWAQPPYYRLARCSDFRHDNKVASFR